jgi:hypothetical protein
MERGWRQRDEERGRRFLGPAGIWIADCLGESFDVAGFHRGRDGRAVYPDAGSQTVDD